MAMSTSHSPADLHKTHQIEYRSSKSSEVRRVLAFRSFMLIPWVSTQTFLFSTHHCTVKHACLESFWIYWIFRIWIFTPWFVNWHKWNSCLSIRFFGSWRIEEARTLFSSLSVNILMTQSVEDQAMSWSHTVGSMHVPPRLLWTRPTTGWTKCGHLVELVSP